MATTNHERLGKALELLRAGLAPFVEREFQARHGKYWITAVTAGWREEVAWRDDADYEKRNQGGVSHPSGYLRPPRRRIGGSKIDR